MSMRAGPPASRVSRQQIIAYLPEELYLRAEMEFAGRETWQQIIGNSLNEAISALGADFCVSSTRERIFVRVQKKAETRQSGPVSRLGKRSIAGWFDKKDAAKLRLFAAQIGETIEAMIIMGLEKRTVGRDPEHVPRLAIEGVVQAASGD